MDRSLIDRIMEDTLEGCDASMDPEKRPEIQKKALRLPELQAYLPNISTVQWDQFLTEEIAENVVPQVWDESTNILDQHLRSLLLIKLFRLDRFVPAAERFVTAVFGPDFWNTTGDLAEVVSQTSATTPIALSSSPGFDASYKVDNLVDRLKVTCSNTAMGSSEG